MNIKQQISLEIDPLLWAKVTVQLLGFQRAKAVGLYHYDTNELPVGKILLTKPSGNYDKSANIYPHDQLYSKKREYGCAPFVLKTAGIQADKLMRLRSNLCLWGAPPPYSGKGCPRKHGEKFKLNDALPMGRTNGNYRN